MTNINRAIRLLVSLSVVLLIVLVGTVRPARSSLQPQAPMPGPDAQQLWNYISKQNPYKSWKNVINQPQRFIHVKENPHGDWVAVYLNDHAYQSFSSPTRPFVMEYGSVVVKENYALSNVDPPPQSTLTSVPVELVSLTVMYKIRGYQFAPGQQEWFWVMYGCNNGQCDGTPVTISDQPWLDQPIPVAKDTFAFYKGEVVAGKPWLCVECHQRAANQDQFAFGDYLWRLAPFRPK